MNNESRESVLDHLSSYKIDERDVYYQLFDVLRVDEALLDGRAFAHVDKNSCVQIIELAVKFAKEYLGKSYQLADKEGCKRRSGYDVRVPEIYHHVWRRFRELGLCGVSAPLEYGGAGTPYVINQAVYSVLYGADPSFCIYPGFNIGAVYLLEKHGSAQQRKAYCQALSIPSMTAALVMTEAGAGSDVGVLRTKAYREPCGRYRIEGDKIFISSGMHNLSENIVYFVVARVEGAPAGTAGLSCFVVPKVMTELEGEPGVINNVSCDRVERKMGLKGNATVQLSFGREGPSYGTLLGEQENKGLSQIVLLMNMARMATGTYALGLAASSYYSAVEYANCRIQGTSVRAMASSQAERLPIIMHMDVQRMLLDMKSKVEGLRALVFKAAHYQSLAATFKADDPELKAQMRKYEGLADLLTPIVKAYCSDCAWRICETAIQVHGGYGYTSDFPVEQNARDVKILSIWEGTNYIQSADFLRNKLCLGKRSRLFEYLREEFIDFYELRKSRASFGEHFAMLENAFIGIEDTLKIFGTWLSGGQIEQIYLMATRFLEAFGDFMLGWLLLENALVAEQEMENPQRNYEKEFYQGKICSAGYFFKNTISLVPSKLASISTVDENFKGLSAKNFMNQRSA